MEPGTPLTPPRRCTECGNFMIWGELHTQVKVHGNAWIRLVQHPEAHHYVTRSDLPPTMGFPVVAAVCPVCGHISLYAAGVVPPPASE
jgi:hypothetical protein